MVLMKNVVFIEFESQNQELQSFKWNFGPFYHYLLPSEVKSRSCYRDLLNEHLDNTLYIVTKGHKISSS